jgi:hypothetical protein
MIFDRRLFDRRLFDIGELPLPSRLSVIYLSGKQETDIDVVGKFETDIDITGSFFDQIDVRGVSETEG